jgi:hypothetical protein
MKMGGARYLLATSLLALNASAQGGETIGYGYDSLGRLVRVEHSGTVNEGVNAAYCYDSADNRTLVMPTTRWWGRSPPTRTGPGRFPRQPSATASTPPAA